MVLSKIDKLVQAREKLKSSRIAAKKLLKLFDDIKVDPKDDNYGFVEEIAKSNIKNHENQFGNIQDTTWYFGFMNKRIEEILTWTKKEHPNAYKKYFEIKKWKWNSANVA